MEHLTPIIMGIAGVFAAVGTYLKTKAANTVTYADGWQNYSKKLEDRISALELSLDKRENEHSNELARKNERITALEQRVDFLEQELGKQLELNNDKIDRVEQAKLVLHEEVEHNLENLKI